MKSKLIPEIVSTIWTRNNSAPSCLYSLIKNKSIGRLIKRPHHTTGYWFVNYKGKLYAVHRVLWFLDGNGQVPDGYEIDHIDRNGANNVQNNLRLLTSIEQKFNRSSNSLSTSRYKGVCWLESKGKWKSQIQINKKKIFIGYFSTEIEAAIAYDNYAKEHAPKCAVLNFH